MRARMAASGRRPRAAPRLSVMCSGLLVPGMTAVTVGLASRYLRKNCAQLFAEQRAASERQGAEHRAARLGAGGQNAFLDIAIVDGIVHFHEIRFFTPDDRLAGGIGATESGGDAVVADEPLCLQRVEFRQALIGIADIVKL